MNFEELMGSIEAHNPGALTQDLLIAAIRTRNAIEDAVCDRIYPGGEGMPANNVTRSREMQDAMTQVEYEKYFDACAVIRHMRGVDAVS